MVARFADRHTIKGATSDFLSDRDVFHVIGAAAPAGADPLEIHVGSHLSCSLPIDVNTSRRQCRRAARAERQ